MTSQSYWEVDMVSQTVDYFTGIVTTQRQLRMVLQPLELSEVPKLGTVGLRSRMRRTVSCPVL